MISPMVETAKPEYFGAEWCGDCRRATKVLADLHIDYIHHDVEHDEAAMVRAIEISGRQNIPVILFPDGTHLVEPSNKELEAKLRELNLVP